MSVEKVFKPKSKLEIILIKLKLYIQEISFIKFIENLVKFAITLILFFCSLLFLFPFAFFCLNNMISTNNLIIIIIGSFFFIIFIFAFVLINIIFFTIIWLESA